MDGNPSPPSSPGVQPIQLQHCIEELLKFTLLCSTEGTFDSGISKEFCTKLLAEDQFNLLTSNTDPLKGVPSYPLYKRLASSLYESIRSESFVSANVELIPVTENYCSTQRVDEWNELIAIKGPALLNMLKEVDFELHVSEPYFSQLNDGLKTVEGRCAVGDYKRIQSGDVLLLNKCLALQVQDIRLYASFHEMLERESLAKVLPGVRTVEEGVGIYRNFYSKEKEKSNGVIAIHVKRPTSQLHEIMASIISGLNYEGIQKLLGFVQTAGTNTGLLPPPTSTLLSTFVAPHNPDVKGSTLTDGARALTKHVNRSSNGYWGYLHGNDFEKNKHAFDVIRRIMRDCSWLNMHFVPPHGIVFEIRTAEGYGARWSADGAKFIGFLEPYMVDGHSKGWKH